MKKLKKPAVKKSPTVKKPRRKGFRFPVPVVREALASIALDKGEGQTHYEGDACPGGHAEVPPSTLDHVGEAIAHVSMLDPRWAQASQEEINTELYRQVRMKVWESYGPSVPRHPSKATTAYWQVGV